LKTFKKIVHYFLSGIGVVAIIMIILSFTSLPYHAYHWTGYFNNNVPDSKPNTIVLMGAGGFPGSESLLRCYYTAEAASEFPEANIIIAFPADTNNFEASDHQLMIRELMHRGVDSSRITSEKQGHNTYTQAVNISKMINLESRLLIVTSPVHTYRSIKTFEKQGFKYVFSSATIEGYTADSLFLSASDKNRKIKSPDSNLGFRYNMWGYLKYQIEVAREWIAIAYYRFKGYL